MDGDECSSHITLPASVDLGWARKAGVRGIGEKHSECSVF